MEEVVGPHHVESGLSKEFGFYSKYDGKPAIGGFLSRGMM